MINALNGVITQTSENNVIVNVSGVEYILETSSKCSAYYSRFTGKEPVRVLTVFVVREDAMILYGFIDNAERECFNQLLKVPGIAGKGALKILSAISVSELIGALDRRDLSTLSRIPGIGNKTAQKLILQLRDTLVYVDDSPSGVENTHVTSSKDYEDVIESFTEMGFDKKLVVKTLDKLLEKEKDNVRSMNKEQAENYLFPLLLRSLT